ncbi:hypothetical protein AB1Y20_021114 [Prymnesium parvum]|uniref:Uncharacterized protein n=1 Tax=Prymnesium parvum TaxID=97485 RepID=A0AB34JIQ2_PRYPA
MNKKVDPDGLRLHIGSLFSSSDVEQKHMEDAEGPYQLLPAEGKPHVCCARRVWLVASCTCATAAFVGMLLFASRGDGATHMFTAALRRVSLVSTVFPVEVAYISIIRHGEKHDGDGLSDDGKMRAQYLTRCIISSGASVAFPLGHPTYVMASHGKPGKSYRTQATASPIAEALGIKLDDSLYYGDATGFSQAVQKLLHHEATVLVTWHHNEIHSLVQKLLEGEAWKKSALGYRDDWPRSCGDEAWSAHRLPGSTCYDLIWRLTLTRKLQPTGKHKWEVTALTSTLEGFQGDPEAPCAEGLAPIKYSWFSSSW